jgi:hypothetical protein
VLWLITIYYLPITTTGASNEHSATEQYRLRTCPADVRLQARATRTTGGAIATGATAGARLVLE